MRIDCSGAKVVVGLMGESCIVQCQLFKGHSGKHHFEIDWADRDDGGGGEEAGVREPLRPKPDAGAMVAAVMTSED